MQTCFAVVMDTVETPYLVSTQATLLITVPHTGRTLTPCLPLSLSICLPLYRCLPNTKETNWYYRARSGEYCVRANIVYETKNKFRLVLFVFLP